MVVELEPGPWNVPIWPEAVRAGFGLLMLDGLLLRRLSVGGRGGAELVGQGDVLRPWQQEEPPELVVRTAEWHVLEPVRLAVLDVEFALRIARYPEITGELMGRMMRRARNLAVNLAIVQQRKIDARVEILFAQLAARWGKVRSDGVLLPITLSHAVLAELVAARRPTVSSELKKLERRGTITRTNAGLLLREPLFERARRSVR